jgi:hypothetical protein
MEPGSKVTTLAELPVGSTPESPIVPAGTAGIVRRAYTDALGGFQVDFTVSGKTVSAIVYANQMVAHDKPRPRADTEDVEAPQKPSQSKPSPDQDSSIVSSVVTETARQPNRSKAVP